MCCNFVRHVKTVNSEFELLIGLRVLLLLLLLLLVLLLVLLLYNRTQGTESMAGVTG